MQNRLTLVFLIDALGAREARSPAFLPECDVPRAPVRSVLGYSSAAIPTLLSGVYPSVHGHLSMYRRAARDGVFRGALGWLAGASHLSRRHWTLRRLIARALRWRGITGYFALYDIPLRWLAYFDLCQRRDLFAPGAFEGRLGLADLAARTGRARFWNWAVPEEQAFRELNQELQRGEKNFLLLYTSELDGLMHATGPNAPEAGRRLAQYDARIREALRVARESFTEVRLFVFGDHGMAEVTRVHDLWRELEGLQLRVPQDYLFFLDSTMARFWFGSETARRRVTDLLRGTDYGRILEEDELDRLGARFPRQEYGELLFLLREGDILVPSFMSRGAVRGMHGYHPDDPSAYTSLVTNVHGLDYPTDLTGIFRILASELELAAGAGVPGDPC